MKIKQIILLCVCSMIPLACMAESKQTRSTRKHEVRIGYGDPMYETMRWKDEPNKLGVPMNVRQNYRYTGHIYGEYMYRINSWLGVGGHAAVATQEFIESHADYLKDLPITRVLCGGGPYDPMVTYDVAKKTDVIGFPAVVPMFLQGTIYANDLNDKSLSMPITEADFLSEAMLKDDRYKVWLNSKAYTMDQVNLLMKGIGCGKFSTILRPEALEEDYPQNKILFQKLKENATTNFCPVSPMFIFHSKGDDVVTFENAEILQKRFRELGADESKIEYDFADYGTHRSGLLKFHMKVLKMLK